MNSPCTIRGWIWWRKYFWNKKRKWAMIMIPGIWHLKEKNPLFPFWGQERDITWGQKHQWESTQFALWSQDSLFWWNSSFECGSWNLEFIRNTNYWTLSQTSWISTVGVETVMFGLTSPPGYHYTLLSLRTTPKKHDSQALYVPTASFLKKIYLLFLLLIFILYLINLFLMLFLWTKILTIWIILVQSTNFKNSIFHSHCWKY